MMQKCNLCPEWAQWCAKKRVPKIVYDPVFDEDGKITGRNEITIAEWQTIALLCGSHYREQKEMPENNGLRFDFIGAAPMRVNCS